MIAPPLSNRQKGTILGIALAAISMIIGSTGMDFRQDGIQELGAHGHPDIQRELAEFRRNRAVDSVLLRDTHEDVDYIRKRLDTFLDNARVR